MTFEKLYDAAFSVVDYRKLSPNAEAGSVGAALYTDKGNIYTGICVDTACSMGFCAEHAAAAQMLTNKESRVLMMIAVGKDGEVMAPCGRCREFISQLHEDNLQTEVFLSKDQILTLKELLPYNWQ